MTAHDNDPESLKKRISILEGEVEKLRSTIDELAPAGHFAHRNLTDAERGRLEANKILEAATNTQQDTFFVMEMATGQAVLWNRAFREISGYTDDEIAALKAPESYYSEKDLEAAGAVIRKALEGETTSVELELVTKTGQRIPTEYLVSPIAIDDGAPKYLISIGRDVTRRSRAEKALRESEERFRLLIENIPSVAWVTDQNGGTSYISPNIESVYGFTTDQILSGGEALWFDRIHPQDRDRVIRAFQGLFSDRAVFDVEYRILHKDGHWIWLHDRANIVE